MSSSRRLALLIDAENMNASCVDDLMKAVHSKGVSLIRRAYGHAERTRDWTSIPGLRFVHVNSAKNAADMALCIDALDLFYRDLADEFVVVSSDSDFMHLAHYLREHGAPVYGFGGANTKAETRAAYSEFTELGTEAAPTLRKNSIEAELEKMVRENGGQLKLAKINELMRRARPDFKISGHPKTKTWRSFVSAHPTVFRLVGTGAETLVKKA
ncbi:NYN domain-containing protein [Pseudothioclava nitratireducens]|uniref:NYN domain-containing protein n=1 Tax=Pseudothioclava nitratireducens TaxID=1928646 RepID=UPI0023DB1E20|nr:NYN domain-containing protein [Defluviimonas nitratireducens]MDF1619105.1 NYN domain-containing protein [Defluviimonas nitratireducens]